jgi:hypothetical protein
MTQRRWITGMRRQRFAIGLIAAYALLLSSWLPAFASVADPLQASLGEHLCGPGGASQSDNAPANPIEQQHKCQLCGPACSVGGCAPVAAQSDGVISAVPFVAVTGAPVRSDSDLHSPLSLYPSDAVSQGPPQAA